MLSEEGSKQYLYLSELDNIIIIQNRRGTNSFSWLCFAFFLSLLLVSIMPKDHHFLINVFLLLKSNLHHCVLGMLLKGRI